MPYVFAPEARPNNTTPTIGTFTGSAAAANVNVPAGSGTPQLGDLLIMLVENQGSNSTPTVSGTAWTKITDGTTTAEQVQGNTRLTAWYRIATLTDNATIDDMGDHQAGRIIVFRAGTYDPVNPFNKVVNSAQAATTSVSITGLTTTRDFCTILSCSVGAGPDANGTGEFSGEANADLTGLVECMDNTTAAGDGASMYMLLGVKAAAGAIGATTVTAVNSFERANCMIAINPFVGPVIRAAGAVAANTVAVSPGLPTGTVAGDLLLMFLETVSGAAITASGWSAVPGGDTPNDGTGTRLTVLYKIAAGGDATTTSDSGDHQMGRIIGIVAGSFDATTPFPDTNSNDQAATTSISISGVTTTRDLSMVLAASSSEEPDATSSSEYSAWANADLAWCNEIIDNTSTVGTGSSIGVGAGIDTVAGSVGATTATAVTSGARANVCIVVQPPSTATDYTLDAQPGSFTVTGFATTLAADRIVDAQPGSYTVTGVAAVLSRGVSIDAQPGSYIVTGVAAGLQADRIVDAQPGSFAVTGAAATLSRGVSLDAQPGSFTITGVAAGLPTVALLDSQPGSYAITGVAAALQRDTALNAQPGAYVITGVDATLEYVTTGTQYTLDAQPGSFVITGAPATLAAAASLDAQPGSFLVTGAAAGLSAAWTVNAEPGSFVVTGVAASLLGAFALNAQPGAFTITGFDAMLQLAGMPQMPLVGDIVLVSATGEIRVIAAEAEIALVRLEGGIAVVQADGTITTINLEGGLENL